MNLETEFLEKREKAKKRVNELKQFYSHIRVYILVNILLLLLKSEFIDFVTGETDHFDPNFIKWLDLNVIITPVLWGIGLLIHGLYAYRHKFVFIKRWEQVQIQKFLEEEEKKNSPYD